MSTKPLKNKLAQSKKQTRQERLNSTIRKKIDKSAERKNLIDNLITNSLDENKRNLLKSSSKLGTKESNKESIARQKKEIELNVKGVVPKDRFQRDIDINKKVIRPDNIPDQWDDLDEPMILEPTNLIDTTALEQEIINNQDKLDLKSKNQTIDKRRQENAKKKYFFWSKENKDIDFAAYDDIDQTSGSYITKATEDDKSIKEQKNSKNLTTTTTTTTSKVKPEDVEDSSDEEEEEVSLQMKTDSNNNSNKRKLDNIIEDKSEKKVKVDEMVKKEEVKENQEEMTKDELERYNLTMESFEKEEDENREYILKDQTGLEQVEEELARKTLLKKKIKYNVINIKVDRLKEVDETRNRLPIMMEEHNIIEKVKENDIIIICGETGSGKTTQVPQFLYESGFGYKEGGDFPGIIGVTQPRRVAAVSTAKRVAHELNVEFGREVGYQIRYDKNLDTSVNKVKFMTDGILMREVQTDFILSQYSCIIIDEAHERNLNTDILIGLLSRIVPQRKKLFLQDPIQYKPLKLIIMSATLRVEDFTNNSNLFSIPPPVINIPTRQFPVTIHFNKKTELVSYIDEAYKKVVKIHKRLPEGGILVFVTGKQEIEQLCSKLRRSYPLKNINKSFKEELEVLNSQFKDEDAEDDKMDTSDDQEKPESNNKNTVYGNSDDNEIDDQDDIDNQEFDIIDDDEIEILEDTDKIYKDLVTPLQPVENSDQSEKNPEDEDKEGEKAKEEKKPLGPLYILPLYSTLPTSKQMRVFQKPPLGSRLVVVATNLAETSLTIPNISYVVDTGRVKSRQYNKENSAGISSFQVSWTSKASADQRAGRAGRTGPGHCYRIYSSAVYNDHFEQFSKPEILLIPIDGMVLQMKSMGIQKITGFPFPTPPSETDLKLALKTLYHLGALTQKFDITPLGEKMSQFPVTPRFSKMLLLGQQHQCLKYIIAIVSILTVKDPFIKEYYEKDDVEDNPIEEDDDKLTQQEAEEIKKQKEQEKRKIRNQMRQAHKRWVHKDSDLLTILKVVGAYDYQYRKSFKTIDKFCSDNFLNCKSMSEIHQLRNQLITIVRSITSYSDEQDENFKPPTDTQEIFIKQVVTGGLIDQIAKLQPTSRDPKFIEYQNCQSNDLVFVHPSSTLRESYPEYIVYCDIIETSRPFMKLCTEINPTWLPLLGKPLCSEFKAIDSPEPHYSQKHDTVKCYIRPNFGNHSWELPIVKIDHPTPLDSLRYFAKALLEGQVFKLFQYLLPYLNTNPSIVTKPNTQLKVYKLIQALKLKKVFNKQQLLAKWKESPSFLLEEYQLWFDKSSMVNNNLLKSIWPPVDSVKIPKQLL
ncbi:DEAD/DEAH box helicase [Tieghemostelium lacteum]|uniref:RNA helicase n=1 Tax=Tieghemostelium lacteum TaxID=361077 RepID=A0A151Z5X7_TIELA|nr:DEAD/DEAH box helicase [Tieghemostelium lacteum]|eukprot:KYQ89362.1 DEAD/DEAH box helicase [Tieghemostelium lacteum]